MKCSAIIVSAGLGKRFGSPDKVFFEVNDKPIFIWAVQAFDNLEFINDIWIVTRKDAVQKVRSYLKIFNIKKVKEIVEGGKERQDSVYNALKVMPEDTEVVLIHDAARPLVSKELVERVFYAMSPQIDGVIPVTRITDTVKWIKSKNIVGGTLNREILRTVQTPQAFWFKKILKVYEKAYREGVYGTDDAFLIERYGGTIYTVEGDEKNIKITTRQDLEKMKSLYLNNLQSSILNIRVGIGHDSHRLVSGRKLIIGGIEIPYEKGLEGHSDADVLVHAIIDAILGSAGAGDIGTHFPDTDPQYRDISSFVLLEKTLKLVHEQKIEPLWIDCIIFAEKPKLSPYIPRMVQNFQKLGLKVNIKAKTAEGMGFIGRGEGIAAQAICLSSIKLEP
ncbi:MAG: 2-C-methyl-D-erythritol 4-phosphate cytidylyltransferase [Thermodesulfovibrio sp.]|jgi:2-C-methyl-D-erythritol 4-phosphate cytidylyltransferase/2-C-methyl-D-erythritol 2,4-cyclodiphosphate synthase|uniref:Bifunctional enzyme IspD/IspF n=1 Tax=Thermodesulfovibrio aggregans TaxID=86166 RepID=A0A2J6WNU7_9BACT|nr:MAG: bifunctional 2-C-methyl-D-erythritol 4-phosphate cytidylyltransferase/2-C-methyl-D-erythritol 2,4-cyclodiphosphate synthase [Thermodesulfovibrio aggregans]